MTATFAVGRASLMNSLSFARTGLVASVALLTAFGVGRRGPARQHLLPGQASIGPTGSMLPAPGGMPLNCTVAFDDGAVNFAGAVTGYAADGYTSTTTIYDQLGQVVGVGPIEGKTVVLSPEGGNLATITDPLGHAATFTYEPGGMGGASHRPDVEPHELHL